MKFKKSICWIRRDLRLHDHHSLHEATRLSQGVAILFNFDPSQIKNLKNKSDRRIQFIWQTLKELDTHLQGRNSRLLCTQGAPEKVIPEICKRLDIEALFVNEDYEPSALVRDKAVESRLRAMGISFFSYKDQVIFSKNDILKPNGEPYRKFTPYKRAWTQKYQKTQAFKVNLINLLPAKDFVKLNGPEWILPRLESLGFKRVVDFNPNPERDKKKLLSQFKDKIKSYHKERDLLDLDSTSHLSLFLRYGIISIRECMNLVEDNQGQGAQAWLTELIWREFFMQILFHYPQVVSNCFRSEFAKIEWRDKKSEFMLWTKGQTGYPLVDAGMRQLVSTGFMPNRVRMVTASFLVKHLFLNPKWGEDFFAQHLLDFDLAANNGNWQWVTGSGCDSAPYFRIFNPDLQRAKFDKNYDYVKKWVPEYGTKSYVSPMVEQGIAFQRAQVLFAKYLKGTKKI